MQVPIDDILQAMRATAIPVGTSGLWSVNFGRFEDASDDGKPIPPGFYTWLQCRTSKTLHQYSGEVVMIDHEPELRTHLNFILQAQGDVLVTGLGLGCVVRGLLVKPDVTRIDIVERDRSVLDLVWPYMPKDSRLHIHEGDAMEFDVARKWQYAWHDLWSDPNRNDEVLEIMHTLTMVHIGDRVCKQGAWRMPRFFSKRFSGPIIR